MRSVHNGRSLGREVILSNINTDRELKAGWSGMQKKVHAFNEQLFLDGVKGGDVSFGSVSLFSLPFQFPAPSSFAALPVAPTFSIPILIRHL